MSLTYSHLSGSIVILGSITASGGFSGSTTVNSTTVDHDATTNFVVNEHIDHSTVSVNPGQGLSGGGTIQTNRSLALDGTSGYFTSSVKNVIETNDYALVQFNTNSYATTSSVQEIIDITGSFATTGSNIFSGSQEITGSFTLTGSAAIGGDITSTGDITAYFSSDENLKNNVELIPDAIDKIKKIKGVSFDWNDKSNHEGHDVGVIAQDIERVLPELVITRDNGFKAVKYDKLVALLIQVNKELIERIENLENMM